MAEDHTREKQYQVMLEYRERQGLESMGLMSSQAWFDDPKRLTFTLARYKFAAKMLSGCEHVLEVGCADAFATRVVLQEVKRLTAVDFDPLFVEDVNARMGDKWTFECRVHDMLQGPVGGGRSTAPTRSTYWSTSSRRTRRNSLRIWWRRCRRTGR